MYDDIGLYIAGEWLHHNGRQQQDVINPATGVAVGQLSHASTADLDQALDAAHRAFLSWQNSSPILRSEVLRRVQQLIVERELAIATGISIDQGKPIAEALAEVRISAEHAGWHAEECRRIYGRVIPARLQNVRQIVVREAVGVCVAFTPWNFPFSQAIRKICAAIGAGCSIILKGPEDAPSAAVALARLFADAGLPAGCLNLVWGVPAEVSEYLIRSPIVRKVSFTGSVPVGKQLAALAGQHMKRTTMELGGHAPVLVFDDTDVDAVARLLAASKTRNAGQICVSPSRFFVHQTVFERFVDRFSAALRDTRLGDGQDPSTQMGPLCHERRLAVMAAMVADARARGGDVRCGGQRLPRPGFFFEPTVVTGLADDAMLMTEEPFGPIASIVSFADTDEVLERANSLPFGLAAYVFAASSKTTHAAARRLKAGMVTINHLGLGLPETPFGGIDDSGHGSEGGSETFDGYLNTKFITQMD